MRITENPQFNYSFGECECGHPIDSTRTMCGSEQFDHLCPASTERVFWHAGEKFRTTCTPSRYTDERTGETLHEVPAVDATGDRVIVTFTDAEARRTWTTPTR